VDDFGAREEFGFGPVSGGGSRGVEYGGAEAGVEHGGRGRGRGSAAEEGAGGAVPLLPLLPGAARLLAAPLKQRLRWSDLPPLAATLTELSPMQRYTTLHVKRQCEKTV
jgi:hypothetical protein